MLAFRDVVWGLQVSGRCPCAADHNAAVAATPSSAQPAVVAAVLEILDLCTAAGLLGAPLPWLLGCGQAAA